MDNLPVLIDIQKELLQILFTDQLLKERFLNISQKNSNHEHSNNFVGFIINKKTGVKGDIGFPVKRLESWAHEYECYMKKLDDFIPQYVSSFEYIQQKDIILVTLHKSCILETLRKPQWKKNWAERDNALVEKNKCILACHLDGQTNSVVNIRTLLYAFFLKRFFSYWKNMELDVICEIRNSSNDEKSNIVLSKEEISYIENELTIKELKLVDTQHGNLLQDVAYLKDKLSKYVVEENKYIAVDGKQLVEEFICKRGVYAKDVGLIKVLDDGKPTSCLKDAVSLKNLLDKNTVNNIVHIVSNQRLFHVQKSALLFHALSDISLQTFCVFEEKPTSMMDSFLDTRKEEVFASYRSKYGRTVSGIQWDKTIKQVAVSSLVLDTFSLSLNNKLKIESVKDVSCLSSSKSLFILYNYARICKLLEHFEEKVNQGVYKPLPDIENVSFSLLTEESEWQLILQYILMYPNLLYHIHYSLNKDAGGHVHLLVNQLCKFLCDLCHGFSSYYHQTKVLLDPQPHLSQLISTRVYLILTLKEIMNHCFTLLGIDPPEQM